MQLASITKLNSVTEVTVSHVVKVTVSGVSQVAVTSSKIKPITSTSYEYVFTEITIGIFARVVLCPQMWSFESSEEVSFFRPTIKSTSALVRWSGYRRQGSIGAVDEDNTVPLASRLPVFLYYHRYLSVTQHSHFGKIANHITKINYTTLNLIKTVLAAFTRKPNPSSNGLDQYRSVLYNGVSPLGWTIWKFPEHVEVDMWNKLRLAANLVVPLLTCSVYVAFHGHAHSRRNRQFERVVSNRAVAVIA
ncbi:hypothetical protein J6590_002813 [Homalodisca vitripennis]|nr:hypothetical protein J6590_002813 [Homalodisca vitripennis]